MGFIEHVVSGIQLRVEYVEIYTKEILLKNVYAYFVYLIICITMQNVRF